MASGVHAGAGVPPVASNMMTKLTLLVLCLIPFGVKAQDSSESYMGSLAPVMRSIQKENGFRLDYFHRNGMPLSEWRQRGRAEVKIEIGRAHV